MAKPLNLPSPPQAKQIKTGTLIQAGLMMNLGKPKGDNPEIHFRCGPLDLHHNSKRRSKRAPSMALGRVSMHCAGLTEMVEFYKIVLGLEVVSGNLKTGSVTLKNDSKHCGHPSALTLYSRKNGRKPKLPVKPKMLSLSLPYHEQEAALDWFDHLEQPYKIEGASWVDWSRVSIQDPEGNIIELVAFGQY